MLSKTIDEILAGYGPAAIPLSASPYEPVFDNDVVFSGYLNWTAAKGGNLIRNTENDAGLFSEFQLGFHQSY